MVLGAERVQDLSVKWLGCSLALIVASYMGAVLSPHQVATSANFVYVAPQIAQGSHSLQTFWHFRF